MRLDVRVRPYDPRCDSASVFFDGVKQRHCICADEEAGFIERYVLDSQGKFVFDAATDEISTEVLYGKVEIILGETP